MQFLKNRTVIGLSCIILSLVICFGITPLLGNVMKAQTEIVRVTKDIKKGEAITSDRLEIIQVGGYNLPVNVSKKMKDVAGKYAAADLQKGDYILNTKISDNPTIDDAYLYLLPEGKEAISISIKSFAAGLSGKLKPGDIVSIIAADYGDQRQTIVSPELQYVKILAVTTNTGIDSGQQNVSKDNSNEQSLPSTVTLLVNSIQAKILVGLEADGKIHISLVYRGSKENVEKLLVEQEKIVAVQTKATDEKTALGGDKFVP